MRDEGKKKVGLDGRVARRSKVSGKTRTRKKQARQRGRRQEEKEGGQGERPRDEY